MRIRDGNIFVTLLLSKILILSKGTCGGSKFDGRNPTINSTSCPFLTNALANRCCANGTPAIEKTGVTIAIFIINPLSGDFYTQKYSAYLCVEKENCLYTCYLLLNFLLLEVEQDQNERNHRAYLHQDNKIYNLSFR